MDIVVQTLSIVYNIFKKWDQTTYLVIFPIFTIPKDTQVFGKQPPFSVSYRKASEIVILVKRWHKMRIFEYSDFIFIVQSFYIKGDPVIFFIIWCNITSHFLHYHCRILLVQVFRPTQSFDLLYEENMNSHGNLF